MLVISLLKCFRQVDCMLFQSLQDVTGTEFKMFMDFLRSLSLFGRNAPVERVQELVEIIEEQADLDAAFIVSCFCLLYDKLVNVFTFNYDAVRAGAVNRLMMGLNPSKLNVIL